MAGPIDARSVAIIAFLLACEPNAESLLHAQSDSRPLHEIAERPLRLSSRGNSLAGSFQLEVTRTVRDDRGITWTRRLLVECKEHECGLVFLSDQRVPWAFLRDRIFVLLDPARPSQFRFLTEGRFSFSSGVGAAGVPGFGLEFSTSRDERSGVTVDLGAVVGQLLATASDISQPADRNYRLECKNGVLATIVLAPADQRGKFPIERLTIEENDLHSITVDRIYVDEPLPVSVLSLSDESAALPKLRGTYRELSVDSKFEEVDHLWETMRDGNPELDATGKLLMQRFNRSTERFGQSESKKPAVAPKHADSASVKLAELLDQPWRLTSRDDSFSTNFQFECVHAVSNEGGKPWIRRMLIQRKGKHCGVLLLSEQYIPWGFLIDGQFLLADPNRPGQYGLLKGPHFGFVGGLGADGSLGFGISSTCNPERTSEIDLNLSGMVQALLASKSKVLQNRQGAFILQSPQGESCTVVPSKSDKFAVERVTLDIGRSMFHFGHFHVDSAPPLDFLTPPDEAHSLPKLSGWSIELPPNTNVDLDARVWARIRDGNREFDRAGEDLLKRFRRTANWPPAKK